VTLTWWSFSDGWFIVFLFGIVLPSPSFYFLFIKPKPEPDKLTSETEFDQEGLQENPLALDSGEGQIDSTQQAPAARSKVIKAQREAKGMRTEIEKLRKENAAMRKTKGLPSPEANRGQANMEMLDDVEAEAPAKTPVDVMKDFAADESLSEEARESAKNALALLVTSQIFEAEEGFDDQLIKQLGAKDDGVAALARQDLLGWLGANRLRRYAEVFMRVAGKDAASGDLLFLTEENVGTIGEAMTHVEKMRLAAALQALREKDQAAEPAAADPE
jgi:hypothetical protein